METKRPGKRASTKRQTMRKVLNGEMDEWGGIWVAD